MAIEVVSSLLMITIAYNGAVVATSVPFINVSDGYTYTDWTAIERSRFDGLTYDEWRSSARDPDVRGTSQSLHPVPDLNRSARYGRESW